MKTKSTKTKHQTQRNSSKKPAGESQPQAGAPIERYRGEPTDDGRTGDEGDLTLETLDHDAPFNQTYGRSATSETP